MSIESAFLEIFPIIAAVFLLVEIVLFKSYHLAKIARRLWKDLKED